ncbi:MAG: GNAT family N-acetyltransferase [Candidatus Dormibacteraeota bacterium]|nr:GNAT family N-acetyltransferase [Candidatus Dormibacteraeota bacterium]
MKRSAGDPPVISEIDDLESLRELEELFSSIWQRPGEPPINSDILKALAHSGNYVVGARAGKRMVGGLVGWWGGSPAHEVHMHSHILGVVEESGIRGLGFELKQHQRSWCLERGVKVMEWTTDPLIRRNAYFNLQKLGALASEYLVDFYGVMEDGLNAGEESDRLLIRWQLDSSRAESAAAGTAGEAQVEDLLREGAEPVLSVGHRDQPVARSSTARVLLCQVPDDIVALRRTDPAAARSWRFAVRRTLADAFKDGFRITGATRTGWYVLER